MSGRRRQGRRIGEDVLAAGGIGARKAGIRFTGGQSRGNQRGRQRHGGRWQGEAVEEAAVVRRSGGMLRIVRYFVIVENSFEGVRRGRHVVDDEPLGAQQQAEQEEGNRPGVG